jgi:hypothetical protein
MAAAFRFMGQLLVLFSRLVLTRAYSAALVATWADGANATLSLKLVDQVVSHQEILKG